MSYFARIVDRTLGPAAGAAGAPVRPAIAPDSIPEKMQVPLQQRVSAAPKRQVPPLVVDDDGAVAKSALHVDDADSGSARRDVAVDGPSMPAAAAGIETGRLNPADNPDAAGSGRHRRTLPAVSAATSDGGGAQPHAAGAPDSARPGAQQHRQRKTPAGAADNDNDNDSAPPRHLDLPEETLHHRAEAPDTENNPSARSKEGQNGLGSLPSSRAPPEIASPASAPLLRRHEEEKNKATNLPPPSSPLSPQPAFSPPAQPAREEPDKHSLPAAGQGQNMPPETKVRPLQQQPPAAAAVVEAKAAEKPPEEEKQPALQTAERHPAAQQPYPSVVLPPVRSAEAAAPKYVVDNNSNLADRAAAAAAKAPAPATTTTTVVTVNIGRIEVRAPAAAADSAGGQEKAALSRKEFSPPLSLAEYLKRRSAATGGGRAGQ